MQHWRPQLDLANMLLLGAGGESGQPAPATCLLAALGALPTQLAATSGPAALSGHGEQIGSAVHGVRVQVEVEGEQMQLDEAEEPETAQQLSAEVGPAKARC